VVEKFNGLVYILVTKLGEFEPKVSYNSASTRDMTQILASNKVLSGSSIHRC